MHPLHARVEHALLAELEHVSLELGARLVVGLLDPGRMDAAVGQQLLQRQPGDFAAHAVETREHHRPRCVVDDEVDAGEVLQRADVAALAADDPALHVVGGQMHHRDRRLGGVGSRQPLHADREDVAHTAFGFALGLLLDLADPPGRVVLGLLLDFLQQHLLGLRARHPGQALERTLDLQPALGERRTILVDVRLVLASVASRRSRSLPRSARAACKAVAVAVSRSAAAAAGPELWVRPYRAEAITIPTAMSAAAATISMVVSSRGPEGPNPFTAFDLRASDRPVPDARVIPGSGEVAV